ncbi:MAG: hypothetical protein SV375_11290 [Thermodesulfobacteriota bacterium]|nr:hypothetical protein [Thermodesulfobacteriota bacterium]
MLITGYSTKKGIVDGYLAPEQSVLFKIRISNAELLSHRIGPELKEWPLAISYSFNGYSMFC